MGKTDFEMLFTTPELLPKLKQYGKILGPRGLMPNPKVGTLVN
jgi:large subunit ribosomal protein L1